MWAFLADVLLGWLIVLRVALVAALIVIIVLIVHGLWDYRNTKPMS